MESKYRLLLHPGFDNCAIHEFAFTKPKNPSQAELPAQWPTVYIFKNIQRTTSLCSLSVKEEEKTQSRNIPQRRNHGLTCLRDRLIRYEYSDV